MGNIAKKDNVPSLIHKNILKLHLTNGNEYVILLEEGDNMMDDVVERIIDADCVTAYIVEDGIDVASIKMRQIDISINNNMIIIEDSQDGNFVVVNGNGKYVGYDDILDSDIVKFDCGNKKYITLYIYKAA